MRMLIRAALTGLFCMAVAGVFVVWSLGVDLRGLARSRSSSAQRSPGSTSVADPDAALKAGTVFIDFRPFEDSGLSVASEFTGPIHDPRSLKELRDSLQVRGPLALKTLNAELAQFDLSSALPPKQALQAAELEKKLGLLSMYEGKFPAASAAFEKALTLGQSAGMPFRAKCDLIALRGIVALRRGELDNCIACVGPSSCIFPIVPEARHTQQDGSREAINHFTAYLKELPGDLRVRWLLNLAYMTLGEYPDKVPPKYLIPLDTFRSKADVGKFRNIALTAGLTSRGPNLAGGSVFDDFTGDGLPDLFTTSLDADLGASLFVNRGDGTFEDRSTSAGLGDQIYALNITRADYDNDGDLDVLLLRGGWEKSMRLSLLKNRGDGTFDDVTIAAGMGEPIQTEAAAWGDFDDDGLVDVYVCGEYFSPTGDDSTQGDPRNRCRLYRNKGDGTFVDVAEAAGVTNEQCAKGAAWGDYDGDGRLDLYVSNMIGPKRLYHNDGNGTFRDLAPELGLTWDARSFSCWFWDYDNDGKLDLFVNEYFITLAETAAIAIKAPIDRSSRPRLFRNLGDLGFEEVGRSVGLDRAMAPMGCNFGDVDNDGYLDIYEGTGAMSYEYLVPNLLFKNDKGGRFEDVTMSSGTGHLQKGHGVSFADYDGDGDLDFFVEAGGAVPGDKSYNLLFQNPGHGRHWLKVRLVGTKTNRSAIGARIRATVKNADGTTRSVYRTVGNNSSFGGNTLVELIGLQDAKSVSELEVTWPTSKSTQTFRDLAADQTIEITEGTDTFKPLAPAGVAVRAK